MVRASKTGLGTVVESGIHIYGYIKTWVIRFGVLGRLCPRYWELWCKPKRRDLWVNALRMLYGEGKSLCSIGWVVRLGWGSGTILSGWTSMQPHSFDLYFVLPSRCAEVMVSPNLCEWPTWGPHHGRKFTPDTAWMATTRQWTARDLG